VHFLRAWSVGLPTRYDQIDHSAIPEDVCVGGWINGWVYKLHNTSGSVQNLTERKQCWLCSKPFLKKLHQLSSATHETSLQGRRKRVCEQHTDAHRGGDRLQSKGEYILTYMFLCYYYYCKFSGSVVNYGTFGSTKDLLLLLFVYLLNLICNPPPTFFTLLHLCFCEEQSENLVWTTKIQHLDSPSPPPPS